MNEHIQHKNEKNKHGKATAKMMIALRKCMSDTEAKESTRYAAWRYIKKLEGQI